MDPVTMALVAAAVSGTTSAVLAPAIKDAYETLKQLIIRRFGKSGGLPRAIDDLEQEPTSRGRQIVVSEKVTEDGAATDPEIVAAAEALLKILENDGEGAQAVQTARGRFIAQASHNSTATVYVDRSPAPNKS